MGRSLCLSVLAALFMSAGAASAADQHGHAHDHKPLYGGVVAEAKDLNFELVAKADSLTLYVVDHGKPVATEGGRATATVYAGNQKTIVPLEPVAENKFVAKGNFKSGVGVRVAVVVALTGKPETKLHFRLK